MREEINGKEIAPRRNRAASKEAPWAEVKQALVLSKIRSSVEVLEVLLTRDQTNYSGQL